MKLCSIEGCPRVAKGISGMCANHKSNYWNGKTSDGIRTGRYRKLGPEQIAEARRMRAALKTNREIAEHFGVSLPTLRQYLRGPS